MAEMVNSLWQKLQKSFHNTTAQSLGRPDSEHYNQGWKWAGEGEADAKTIPGRHLGFSAGLSYRGNEKIPKMICKRQNPQNSE